MAALEDRLYPLKGFYEGAPQIVRTAVGKLYRMLPKSIRHGTAYDHFYKEAADSVNWTPSQIEAYQLHAVNQSLAAAVKTPFYRRKFQSLKLPIQALTELASLPYLTKQDLLTHREDMVNKELATNHALFMTTGGSTGVPVGFYLHRGISRPKELAYIDQTWGRGGYKSGDSVSVLRGATTSSKANGRISWHDATRNWQILSSYHLTLNRIPEYVDALNSFSPAHIHAYPSALLMLARAMTQLGLRLSFQPKSLLCGSEVLTAEDQQWLQDFFEAPVIHWYGHSERAVLAAQAGPTKSRHLYFWPTYGYVEFGESDGNGLREIVATSFHNQVMPLVRYRTGDYALVPDQPRRELPFCEIQQVSGRQHEFLDSASGRKVSLTAINMHDTVFEGLLSVQFRSVAPGQVEFHYQPGPQWSDSQLPAIESALKRKLGDDFHLSFKAVTETQRSSSGKHRWLITPENVV